MRIKNIDLLRTLAVVSVVLFHADEGVLTGGFLGVDIFFVISGFVVSKSIIENYPGYFNFIKRRVFRLVPAATATIFITLVCFGSFNLDILNEKHYQSALFSSLFSSNFFYALDSSYWDPVMQGNPFTHFWSLNVEEQFYLIWPFACIFIFRLNPIIFALSLVALFGFSYGLWSVDKDVAFYMMPYRAAQFAMGSFVFYLYTRDVLPAPNLIRNWWIFPSVTILFLCQMLYVDGGSHWSVVFFFPTILAGVLVYSAIVSDYTPLDIIGRILLKIGEASYSIYLVHWPITVYAHLKYGISNNTTLMIMISSLGVGALLNICIEKQIKFSYPSGIIAYGVRIKRGRTKLVGSIAVLMFVIPVTTALLSQSFHKNYQQWEQNTKSQNVVAAEKALLQSLAKTAAKQLPAEPILEAKQLKREKQKIKTVVANDNVTTVSEPVDFINTRNLEANLRMTQTKNRREKFEKKLRSCNTYEIGRLEGNQRNKLLSDLDLTECLRGNALLVTDSTGPLASQFIASVHPNIELAILASAGCFFSGGSDERPDCLKMNRLRRSEMKNNDRFDVIYFAFNKPTEQDMQFLTTLDKKVVILTPQPSFTNKVPDILRVNPQAKFNLKEYLSDEHVGEYSIIEKAATQDNISLLRWSILDDPGAKIVGVNKLGKALYRDHYHMTQDGITEVIRNFFINNCSLDGFGNICDLPVDGN